MRSIEMRMGLFSEMSWALASCTRLTRSGCHEMRISEQKEGELLPVCDGKVAIDEAVWLEGLHWTIVCFEQLRRVRYEVNC
jgi:hypothetical protein